jgi:hypothetical protein
VDLQDREPACLKCFIFPQIKSRKKNRQVALQYTSSLKALKDEGLVSKPGIKSEIEKLKTDLSNDHLRKMLNMMYDEQNRTEELLTNR